MAGHKQYEYAAMVGIQPAHLSAYLGGNKTLSTDILNRILSGINYSCTITILVHPSETGQDADNADFTPLEETLSSEDQDSFITEI
jgi:hypothetical protein